MNINRTLKKATVAFIILVFFSQTIFSQYPGELTIEKIMSDHAWLGSFPSNMHWSHNAEELYFRWNPVKHPEDSLYTYKLSSGKVEKLQPEKVLEATPPSGVYSQGKNLMAYSKNNTLYISNIRSAKPLSIYQSQETITPISFSPDAKKLFFRQGNNIFHYDLGKGTILKNSHFQPGKKPDESSNQSTFIEQEEKQLFEVIKQKLDKEEKTKNYHKATARHTHSAVYLDNDQLRNLQISPDEKYIFFTTSVKPNQNVQTEVPEFVNAKGHAKMLKARPKVGVVEKGWKMGLVDLQNDTVYYIKTDLLDGIKRKPDFWSEYEKYRDKEPEAREVYIQGPYFSKDTKYAVIELRTIDNKDRFIVVVNPADASLRILDHQSDEAWIAGPGIGYLQSAASIGFLPDAEHIWFQSEESGWSHLYKLHIPSGKKTALTQGNFEIYDPVISFDEKWWYFTSNPEHPGIRDLYRMPVNGGKMEKITDLKGKVDFSISPDNKHIAIIHSLSNQPPTLHLLKTGKSFPMEKIADGISEEFNQYQWRKAEVVQFKAQDGADVYACLYKPDKSNGAAVIFVHGAGYLQNAHYWWSTYFREYMFHNLLADKGYTVLDIDYRGSAGYGRDWRTGIYRHMGGKDLSDHIDGAKYLIDHIGINPKKIGIYGGSYGGFITLMALFKHPGVFAAGAALRSVTDWAHYNHGYTSNILNTPEEDPDAYRRSSPIYFAEGLEDHLLICHGMVDVNVHFQDVVRLAQRLIELGKDNWEFAVYPVEDHAFTEASSWTDEYKRILKLFESTLR
ncbi:MAG: prolyl oligopeptidase family serine peptidase [Cyclobacteriaceae bacterium]|nr:prolyl oligopeptidase family serine peptidase [Cyclobacteriaceae bacterium]